MTIILDMPNLTTSTSIYREYYPTLTDGCWLKYFGGSYATQIPSEPFLTQINSFEINIKFIADIVNDGSTYWCLLGQKTQNRGCPQIEIESGYIKLITSESTGAWTGAIRAPINAKTIYTLNCSWDNINNKIVGTVTDEQGVVTHLEPYASYTDSTTKIVWQDYAVLGSDQGSTYFNGKINLEDSYIKINGELWWEGLTEVDVSPIFSQQYEAIGGTTQI